MFGPSDVSKAKKGNLLVDATGNGKVRGGPDSAVLGSGALSLSLSPSLCHLQTVSPWG